MMKLAKELDCWSGRSEGVTSDRGDTQLSNVANWLDRSTKGRVSGHTQQFLGICLNLHNQAAEVTKLKVFL